jgi:hypothetical protein
MTEILTESFCERCGTRYTFESARPRVRLKGVKVLSRGLKNFVLSDDTSIDEAMAAARSEADREASAHQLDAFHKTFNFCMSCRQYTCPNCWNEPEARCLSCAPLALPEVSVDVHDLRELRQAVLTSEPAPGNGTVEPGVDEGHEPWAAAVEPEMLAEHELAAEHAALAAAEQDEFAAAEAPADELALAEDEAIAGAQEAVADEPLVVEAEEGLAAEAPVAAAEEAAEAAEPAVADEDLVSVEEAVAAAKEATAEERGTAEEAVAAAEPAEPVTETGGAADKAASQTLGLLRRFRPGQSLDAEVDAFERERQETAATEVPADPTAAEAEAAATFVPESGAVEEPAPSEPAAAELAPIESAEPVDAEPAAAATPVEPLEPEAAQEPAQAPAAPQPAPAPEEPVAPPIAAAAAADVVEQPTWRITAPDPTATGPLTPPADKGGSVPLQAGAASPRPSGGEPQWPARPEWPAASASAAGLPFLGRPAAPQGGIDALWAASNQELVTATPAPGKAAGGIQPCISCGLSLSATARFCRRCGTLQGR